MKCINRIVTLLLSWLEFHVPFQHNYGYIRDDVKLLQQFLCAICRTSSEFILQQDSTLAHRALVAINFLYP